MSLTHNSENLFPRLQFFPVSLTFFASFLSFSHIQCLSALLADSYFLLLTFPSHSLSLSPHYVHLISLLPLFSAGVFSLVHTGISPSSCSLALCLVLSFSFECLSLTRVAMILLTLHCLAYQPSMLFIHTHGVSQKWQLKKRYSCVCCACASVIITMAVSRVEQEAGD